MTWLEKTMVGFDTETTGVSTAHDRIVTAAIITRTGVGDDATVSPRTWLINPGVEIPEQATAVHGITNEMARDQGLDPVAALEEIALHLADALNKGIPVVAFNASFDLSILESELRRHHLPSLVSRLETADIRPVVDPLVLDRHLDKWRKGKRKLIDMCATYGVEVDGEDLHAADADVLATLNVVQAMAKAYPTIGEVALTDLHDQQVSAHRAWAESFRAWLTSKGKTEDLPGLAWPVTVD